MSKHDIKHLTNNFEKYLSELKFLIKENKTSSGNCVDCGDKYGMLGELLSESKSVSMAIYEHEWLVDQQSFILSNQNTLSEGIVSNISKAVSDAFFKVLSKILDFFMKIKSYFIKIIDLPLTVTLYIMNGMNSAISWLKKFKKDHPTLFWAIIAVIIVGVVILIVSLFLTCSAPQVSQVVGLSETSPSGTICPPNIKRECISRAHVILRDLLTDPQTTPELKTVIHESQRLLNQVGNDEILSARSSNFTNLDIKTTGNLLGAYSDGAINLLTKVCNLASQQVKGIIPESIVDDIATKLTAFLPSFLSVLVTSSKVTINKIKSLKNKQ